MSAKPAPNGPGAGQSVGHFHFHIFPRWLGDGVAINWEPKPGDMTRIGGLETANGLCAREIQW